MLSIKHIPGYYSSLLLLQICDSIDSWSCTIWLLSQICKYPIYLFLSLHRFDFKNITLILVVFFTTHDDNSLFSFLAELHFNCSWYRIFNELIDALERWYFQADYTMTDRHSFDCCSFITHYDNMCYRSIFADQQCHLTVHGKHYDNVSF